MRTEMINRSIAPPVLEVGDINIPDIRASEINGIKVYTHLQKDSGTFKIELLTKGSQLFGKNAAQVQLALSMLQECTESKTGSQLAEIIDAMGSFLQITPGFDYSSVALFGLSRYFEKNIRLLSEIIYNPGFHRHELERLKEKKADKLKMNLEKGSYVSGVNLRKILFGATHPYGKQLHLEDIRSTTADELKKFHERFTLYFDMYISGDLPADFMTLISNNFNKRVLDPLLALNVAKDNAVPTSDAIEVRDDKYIQSSIKLGKRLSINRNHPDYFPFIVTNELFGGFFGSRLMKNIREEKGYTYGIYTSLYPLLYESYFVIATDVKGAFELQTLDEIFKEMKLLHSKKVSWDELETVKNYMIGVFVNAFNAPFASIDKFKTLNAQHIDFGFYRNYISEIKKVQPEAIIAMAQKYLTERTITKSIVGA